MILTTYVICQSQDHQRALLHRHIYRNCLPGLSFCFFDVIFAGDLAYFRLFEVNLLIHSIKSFLSTGIGEILFIQPGKLKIKFYIYIQKLQNHLY